MKPLKQKVSITLDEDIIERTRLLAEASDRSFSQYVNLMLRQSLANQIPETGHKAAGNGNESI